MSASLIELGLTFATLGSAEPRVRQHRLSHGLSYRLRTDHRRCLQSPYGDVPVGRVRHRLAYTDFRVHRQALRLAYGDCIPQRAQLQLAYADRAMVRTRCIIPYADPQRLQCTHVTGYQLTRRLAAACALRYRLSDRDFIRRGNAVRYALLQDQQLQSVANTPELQHQGRRVRLLTATLSCDEGSPFWMANLSLASLADFAAMALGDAITLYLGMETFRLIIDGKTLSRAGPADDRLDITATSPLALLDAPFAGQISQAALSGSTATNGPLASTVVADLIGPVAWQLPDWQIPTLAFVAVTPLAAARVIVAAIGGVIESHPDGSVTCRPKHPASLPDYPTLTPDHTLFDHDVIATAARIAPLRGFNRVTIANEAAGSTAADELEVTREETETGYQARVRAYLDVPRPVILTHTGPAATGIRALGTTVRYETERVEFVAGEATTRYPVTALAAILWKAVDLGQIKAEIRHLHAEVAGYTLADVTYAVTSEDWEVALAADDEVQFVLIDQ